MWKTWLIAIALLVVMTLGGLVIGYVVGEATCDDPYFQTYPDFRCADEDAAGGALGFGIGLLGGRSCSPAGAEASQAGPIILRGLSIPRIIRCR
jgi:hypothetical protein